MQSHRVSSLFYYLFFVEHLKRHCVDNPFWALYENVLSLLSVSLWSLESFLRWIHRLYCLHHIWELIALLFQQSQSYPVRKKIKHQDTQNVVLRGGLQELLYHKMTILLLLLDELQWIVLEWKKKKCVECNPPTGQRKRFPRLWFVPSFPLTSSAWKNWARLRSSLIDIWRNNNVNRKRVHMLILA